MAQSKKNFRIIVLVTVLLILLTRGLTISHNMELHPDEHVFFNAAQSLKGYLSGSSPIYEEEKEYPEGAIVFQLPIHIATAIINRVFNACISPQLSVRIAAVFYFTLGAVLGMFLIYRYFSKDLAHLILYSFILVFSLVHETQSRYGTSDAITFFLLMSVIVLTAQGLSSHNHRLLYITAAFLFEGFLTATKYPLLFFIFIPIYGISVLLKGSKLAKKALYTALILLALLTGFALCSPKALLDPMYIIRASTREVGAYMGSYHISSVWTHFMSMFIYSMFYSGFPLVPVFFVIAVRKMYVSRDRSDSVQSLLYIVVPLLTAIFFIYNIFVQLLVSRTFHPFFFLSDIYVAIAAGDWVLSGKWRKVSALILCTVMVVRGSYFIYLLSEKNDSTRLAELIFSSVDENWDTTTILSGFLVFPDGYHDYPNVQVVNSSSERFSDPDAIKLKHGELFIAGARDYTVYSRYYNFLPSRHNDNLDSLTWVAFLNANSEYYTGSLYPDYIYYLFGLWLMGTNGCYEFPDVNIFYCP